MCTSIAPGTFELDADQELIVLHEVPPPGEEEAVRDAVVCCPVEALRLDDEGTRP
ncbi:MAG: ferredoxin [Actinobacteria bacterium]|nr:ferredoxin [Actinomycetota bacterium]